MAIEQYDFIGVFNEEKLAQELRTLYPVQARPEAGVASINNGVRIIIDSIISQNDIQALLIDPHNPDDKTTEQQIEADDSTAFSDLLSKAQAGLAQITTDKSTLANAGNLADVKPVVSNILTRQEEIIKALAGAIRKLT